MKHFRASIDIGSNSLNLLLAEVLGPCELREIKSESFVTQLGKGVQATGVLAEENLLETYKALAHCKHEAEKLGISANNILAVATEASRVASNSTLFYEKVQRELGIVVKIISGDQEAKLSALAGRAGKVSPYSPLWTWV